MITACHVYAQSVLRAASQAYVNENDTLPDAWIQVVDSSFYLLQTGSCKSMYIIPVFTSSWKEDTVTGVRIRSRRQYEVAPVVKRKPLLTVHGNIMYDLYYQSNSDTPYLEKEIYQHTVQTTLDITYKDQYPLHLTFSTSKSNSQLLRSITGVNLQYTNRDFKNTLINKAQAWDAGKLKQLQEVQALKSKLDGKWDTLYRFKNLLSSPGEIQRLVEARERELYGRLEDKKPQLPQKLEWPVKLPFRSKMKPLQKQLPVNDSSFKNAQAVYDAKVARLDSLQQELAALEQLYKKAQQRYGVKKEYLMDVLTKKGSNKELIDNLEAMNIPDSVLPKGYKTLLALRSIGIGRTMVDYSELTAKNVSIIGVQAEFNPSYYVAVASGAVDYRFRDFVVNQNRTKQYLNIVRVGTGMRDGNNIILSYYTGKKQAYNFNTAPGVAEMPDYRVMGVSLEGRWQLDKNNYIIGEAAKSSLPSHARVLHQQGMVGSMVGFNDHSNEAYAVSAASFIPASRTRINGMYKLMGANFQSFSLYSSGSKQSAWMLKVDQPFFKQQLTISASIRKNAYTSIFENASYMSNTIFKSIQATFRRRHWPVVTVGYYPSSQLMKLGEDKYMENMFYTMVGTVSHYYKYRNMGMNTMFSGTKFYNRQADSNFVYFNSTNLLLNQTVFAGKFTINGSLSAATNQDYALYGTDGNVQYKVRKWLDVGGGLKYNYQTVYDLKQLGYTANTRIVIPKIGEIMLLADQGFVPGADRKLVPNKTGRLTYTKIF